MTASTQTALNCVTLDHTDPAWNETLHGIGHETYHRPEYLALEANRTGSLARAVAVRDASGEKLLFVPFLLRDCTDVDASLQPGTVWDVVSPYGYSGYLTNGAASQDLDFCEQAFEALVQHWKQEGVCSAYLRLNPILNNQPLKLDGLDSTMTSKPTVSIELAKSEEEIWNDLHRKHRTSVRRSRRINCSVREVDYVEYLPVFREIYEDTMQRTSANDSYYFNSEYFQGLAAMRDDVHLLVVEFEEEIVAGTLFFECGGIVQAHLGGTRSEHINLSPLCILLHETSLWANARGNRILHLGGGLGGGDDKVFQFKSRFSEMRHEYRDLRIVVDREAYEDLISRRSQAASTTPESLSESGFFPTYRSGLNDATGGRVS